MKDRLVWIISLGIIVAALLAGLLAAPYLPESVASHWNAAGEVDGYSSRAFGLFFLPGLMLAITLLMLAIPHIDPLKSNIQQFRAQYNVVVVVFNLFMFYIHALTLLWGLGVVFNMNRAMPPAFALLFIVMGNLLGKTRRNYMIGIRTPWTLASDVVWDKTHRLGGLLFKLAGLVVLLGVIFPRYTFLFLLVPALGAAAVTLVYSYLVFRREQA